MAATKKRVRRTSLEVERERLELDRIRLDRARAAHALRLYDAAKTDDRRPRRGTGASGNAVMQHAGNSVRETARWLDENDGTAIGILDDLVDNVVGTGVTVEPMVRTTGGEPAADLNKGLRELHAEWWERPDITGTLPGTELERLAARTLFRDGEVFAHHVESPRAPHPGPLPYSLEMLEADYVPFDHITASTTNPITHGVERDAWGRPLAYWVYLQHPGDVTVVGARRFGEVKRVRAEEISHLAFRRRLHQVRGVSVIHGAVNTLYDLKEAWESERIAMRVAAAMTGYVRRGADFESAEAISANVADSAVGARNMEMAPGMIFDVMADEVGTIGHDRPNQQFDPFSQALLRQVAGATGTRYSAIAHRYDGTYSAQRQELVEGTVSYRRLFAYLLGVFYRPVWRRFVTAAVLGGKLRIPAGVDRATLAQCEFRPPALPWIDPLKEMQAYKLAVEAGFKSRQQVIRDMGADPADVDHQIEADAPMREALAPTPPPPPPQAQPAQEEEDEDNARMQRIAADVETRFTERLERQLAEDAALRADLEALDGEVFDTRAAVTELADELRAARAEAARQQAEETDTHHREVLEQVQAALHESQRQAAEALKALQEGRATDVAAVREAIEERLAPIEARLDEQQKSRARVLDLVRTHQPTLAEHLDA